jgi:hypothetical protein
MQYLPYEKSRSPMKSPEAHTIQILHIGADTELLLLRTAVLQKHWFIKSAHFQDAITALRQSRFDLVLLCHSVPDDARKAIENFVGGISIRTVVLALSRELREDQIVRTGLGLQISSGPASLVRNIEEVLRKVS